ncbi:hypothetical protein [Streptomyces sp. STR69]|uniref:hypothetical protein n=1 Tax=Streptomyces sp. STR69 TaxID=1796942 RepID=UPI0021C921BA|nr:hypothetical protein [Streptomyces sp. STR69]
MSEVCRVYWGARGCALPHGHDPAQQVRTHRTVEPTEQEVTVRDAFLFGEDLTPEELRLCVELYGE